MPKDKNQNLDEIQDRLDKIQAASTHNSLDTSADSLQQEILGFLSGITHNLSKSTENRRNEHVEVVQRITRLESALSHLSQDISSLCKVVRDGNGQPSLVHKIGNLENLVKTHSKQLVELNGHANSIIAAKMLTRSQIFVALTGMMFTALLALASFVATLIK
jgi:hypothetical protein